MGIACSSCYCCCSCCCCVALAAAVVALAAAVVALAAAVVVGIPGELLACCSVILSMSHSIILCIT